MIRKLISKIFGGFRSGPEVVGPHVIEPTDKKIGTYHNGEYQGEIRQWECRYCNWIGAHPKDSIVHISIRKDCSDAEWLDSELERFRQKYGDH